MAAPKTKGINRSKFCRDHINKVGLKNASAITVKEAWLKAGHDEKDCPSSTLFYQQTKKIRAAHKARGKKAANSRAAKSSTKVPAATMKAVKAPAALITHIESELEKLTVSAEALKLPKLAEACRNARRQAGAEILAAE